MPFSCFGNNTLSLKRYQNLVIPCGKSLNFTQFYILGTTQNKNSAKLRQAPFPAFRNCDPGCFLFSRKQITFKTITPILCADSSPTLAHQKSLMNFSTSLKIHLSI